MKSHNWRSSYPGFYPSSYRGATVKMLIIINIVVFVLIHLPFRFPWLSLFGMVPAYVFARFRLWQLVTYLFLHEGLFHLLINMLMLWWFGSAIEKAWGKEEFLLYFFFTGIGAAFCSFIVSFRSSIPVIGASGAIFGILVAYAVVFPKSIILLFFIFPLKIKHAVLVLAGINLLGALATPHSGIAYFAHLGGGLFGYLYLKNEWIRKQILWLRPGNLKSWWVKKKIYNKQLSQKDLDLQVDSILDKVSRYGMRSLTRKERKILEHKSKGIY